MENNFIFYGIEPAIAEKMRLYRLQRLEDFEKEAAKAARELVPSSPRELLEVFHSLQRMAEKEGYKSQHDLGWMDVVEAAREIVKKAFLELSEDVACEECQRYIDSAYI